MIKCMVIGHFPATIHTCPSVIHTTPEDIDKIIKENETIPHFTNEKRAHEAGWRRTRDRRFSPRGSVWVCPDCARKLDDRNRNDAR